ncbi:outer membrane beta-barrel protein [Vibrio natriegens]|uniref:outer membrane beta-barrel protein n=1 Tax=Vibrio natriegens TaxID=691 RepID=UPI0030490212
MKKALLVGASVLLLGSTSKIALAEEYPDNLKNLYFGIGGSFLNIDVDGRYYDSYDDLYYYDSGSADGAGMVGLIGGYQINKWVSAEVRGYLSVSDGDFYGDDVEISKYFAIYAKPTLPLHKYVSIYGLLGYGSGTLKYLGESDTESDITYGVGVEVGKGGNVKLQIEYAVFHDEDYSINYNDGDRISYDLEISGVNANLVWYF